MMWHDRIKTEGILLIVIIGFCFVILCAYACMCVRLCSPLAGACGFQNRVGGTDMEDLINQPESKEAD